MTPLPSVQPSTRNPAPSLALVPVSEGSHSAASRLPTSFKMLAASKTVLKDPIIVSELGRILHIKVLNVLFKALLLLISLEISSLRTILLNELGPLHLLEPNFPLLLIREKVHGELVFCPR